LVGRKVEGGMQLEELRCKGVGWSCRVGLKRLSKIVWGGCRLKWTVEKRANGALLSEGVADQ
jgi:hypothetical protein